MSFISYTPGDEYSNSHSLPFNSRPISYGAASDELAFYFDTSHDDNGIPTLVNLTTGREYTRSDLNGTDYGYYLNFSDVTGHLTLNGSVNGDVIVAGSGDDHLLGDDGDDDLDGGRGADLMEGGNGDDTFAVDNKGDQVLEARGAGHDTINTTVSYSLKAGQEIELLNALSAKAVTLVGNAFGQTLDGDAGGDRLIGGGGADMLVGGRGADQFVFKTLADSTVSATGRDTILDFNLSQGDRIDLRSIDADTLTSGDQSFCFIGSHAFTKTAGELQAKYSGGNTLVSGDVDGNGKADFAILLKGHVALDSGDFLL